MVKEIQVEVLGQMYKLQYLIVTAVLLMLKGVSVCQMY